MACLDVEECAAEAPKNLTTKPRYALVMCLGADGMVGSVLGGRRIASWVVATQIFFGIFNPYLGK